MELEYNITNQVIERCDKHRPANHSQKYLELTFTFSDDWSGLAKFALFKTSNGTLRTALSEDKVIVPASVLREKKFLFSLYGVDGDDLRVTTNQVKVNLLESGFTHDTINDDSDLDDPTTVEEIYTEISKKAYSSDMTTALAGKSDVGHTHSVSDITDLTMGYYSKVEVDNLLYNLGNQINLSADKEVIQVGDTCTFTTYVVRNGLQKNGEPVITYLNESVLDETVTDGAGKVSVSYTGVGAGKLEIVSESRDLTSATVEVVDSFAYFDGVVNNHFKNTTETSTADGIQLTSSSQNNIFQKNGTQLFIPTDNDFCIEFDLINNNQFAVYLIKTNDTRYKAIGDSLIAHSTFKNYKYVYNGTDDTMKQYIDGVLVRTDSDISITDVEYCGFAFVDWQSDLSCIVKHLRVYPI